MKKQRVYIDTSVIGGCYDPEFALWSNGLMKDFRLGTLLPVISEVLAAEIKVAPENVREVYANLVALGAEQVEITQEVVALSDLYQSRGILTPRYYDDGLHVALSTVHEVDVIVSWNFRHIVHLDKIRLFNAVNIERGYRQLQIYSPREVTNFEIPSYGAI